MGLSLTGLVGSALAGGGQAAGEVAQSQIDYGHKLDLAQAMSDMELQKQMRADEFHVRLQDQQRTRQTQAVESVMPGLVNSALAKKYPNGGVVAPLPETTDTGGTNTFANASTQALQGRQDQSMANDREALMNSDDMRVSALKKLGYVDPNTQATVAGRQDVANLKGEFATALNENRYNTLAAIAQANDATRNRQLDDLRAKYSDDRQFKLMLAGLRGANGGDKTPANVATAEWLVKNGVAKDNEEAWGMVTSGKSKDPVEMAIRTASVIMTANPRVSPADAFAQARSLIDVAAGAASAPAPAASAPAKTGWSWPKWLSGDSTAPSNNVGAPTIATKSAYDAMPSGAVFTAPDGSRRVKP